MFLARLKIAPRLALVLTLILAVCLASSGFAIHQFRVSEQAMQDMLREQVETERLVNDWYTTVYAACMQTAPIARSRDTSVAAYYVQARDEIRVKINELQKAVADRISTPAERAAYQDILARRGEFQEVQSALYRLKQAGDHDQVIALFDQRYAAAAARYQQGVRAMMQVQRDRLNESAARERAAQDRAVRLLQASALLALLLGAGLAVVLVRSITRPLAQAQRVASAIAAMDLSGTAQPGYAPDETGALLRALDQMRGALRQALHEVQDVARDVGTASTEIALGNRDLSGRTEQAASGLQQTASSMEEIAAAVQQTAASAQTADDLARTASASAGEGGDVVGRVVESMHKISSSSARIGEITALIDTLSFQTNILALNAAVEAARAGEQGRGFAVVAGEVRALAQRSTSAAREIRGLIDGSVAEVAAGAQLAQQAGSSIDSIVANAQRVSALVSEISRAALEQSGGIHQVNQVVTQLDRTTQQNAALVEQSSAATESLRAQAQRLGEVIARFKLQA